MARQRLRPGTWRATNGSGSTSKIQIDYEWFEVPNGVSVEFSIEKMGVYDTSDLDLFRNPTSPITIVTNTGVPEYESNNVNKVLKNIRGK
jgi:hypothetical protein